MPKLRSPRLLVFILVTFFLSAAVVAISAISWLKQPNNFIYTKEASGSWSPTEKSGYRASGYNLKINATCAQKIYEQIPTRATDFENEMAKNDYRRFLTNKASDIEFKTSEISYTGRFKWFKNNYVTYNDPSLQSGIRFSFGNKCLYDKECSLGDSLDYLLVKIGAKYLLSESQSRYLLDNCVTNEKVFFKITNKYNFGRSQLYYRNGLGIWLGIWYNMLALGVLVLSVALIIYYITRKKS